jgi:hypothetical protein
MGGVGKITSNISKTKVIFPAHPPDNLPKILLPLHFLPNMLTYKRLPKQLWTLILAFHPFILCCQFPTLATLVVHRQIKGISLGKQWSWPFISTF